MNEWLRGKCIFVEHCRDRPVTDTVESNTPGALMISAVLASACLHCQLDQRVTQGMTIVNITIDVPA